ncbi:ATP-binding cassette domain-containing protein [uncultured Desulfobacter sp.]|uniref:ATP-binding cassette domain-containing protein n=1 Tax=uncultured Desulfobacter sp. TaxID=240139 RepID=UPI0029F53C04|nr:ATP-binding cassette domain-containing protein [uncultured Desulfobacter sp.]
MSDRDLLYVKDLCIGIPGEQFNTCLVDNVSFSLNPGEVLGITGQSGSGKTLTAMALAGILPRSLAVLGGHVRFMGKPILPEKGAQKNLVPGRDVLMLSQSPARALDPWVKIGIHLIDAVKAAIKKGSRIREKNPKNTAIYALETVGLGAWTLDRYPFELSGGQCRRCLMALAMAVRPRILIADEPATGQDDDNRALVERCILNLTRNAGTAVIVISHDLRGLQKLASELIVIFNGSQIEAGPVRDMIDNPCHVHTRDLVYAMKFLEGA